MATSDAPTSLQIERSVPFGHCDPAGILYTPRALDFCLEAIDDFWKTALSGPGWYEMNVDLDRGTPFVNVNIDFKSPITARSPLLLTVTLAKTGTSSVTFNVLAAQADQTCFTATLTSVIVIKSTMTKVDGSDWLRRVLPSTD